MSSQPVRTDHLSAWQLPPEGALRAGQVRPIRAFDSAGDALAFIAVHGSRSKRARARRNRGTAIAKVEITPAVVDGLCRARYLTPDDTVDWPAVERAVSLVLQDWLGEWERLAAR